MPSFIASSFVLRFFLVQLKTSSQDRIKIQTSIKVEDFILCLNSLKVDCIPNGILIKDL